MPLKLPAPDCGTDAQPGPKFVEAVLADELIDGDAAGWPDDDDEAVVPLEPQAAAPRARLAAAVAKMMPLFSMVLLP
ncbi:MAG TPA: hypothetical protein VMR00_04910 [Streptosporangiaceae bacterium]|jgi:hypothetical protein|nr:hypothetical protein [Streptosporangiaceae bacterium]